MPDIKVTPLGAGQDVGRSCILLTMGGKLNYIEKPVCCFYLEIPG